MALLSSFLAVLAFGQAAPDIVRVGRFGGPPPYEVGVFRVSGEGFTTGGPPAFAFPSAGRGYYAAPADWWSKTLLVPGLPGGPSKLRVLLPIAGFDAYFPGPMRVRVDGASDAFLTWTEGSVGIGVPAPGDAPWLLVSFRPASPVVGMRFERKPTEVSLKHEGEKLWLTAEAPGGVGWVRFVAPLGEEMREAANAASLGDLERAAAPMMDTLSACVVGPAGPLEVVGIAPDVNLYGEREPTLGPTYPVPPAVVRAAKSGLCYAPDLDVGPAVEPAPALSENQPAYLLGTGPLVVHAADLRQAERVRSLADGGDLPDRFAARFYLTDLEQEALRDDLAAAARPLITEEAWETWRDGLSGRSVPRLRSAASDPDPISAHARAGVTIAAAVEFAGVAVTDAALALRRCCEFVDAYMDWATMEPMYGGKRATADQSALCLALAQAARHIGSADEAWDRELHWLAARLLLAIRLRWRDAKDPAELTVPVPCAEEFYLAAPIQAQPQEDAGIGLLVAAAARAAPAQIGALPPGRLLRAEYEGKDEMRLLIAPGPEITLTGYGDPPRDASLRGHPLAIKRPDRSGWTIEVPALTLPAALALRFGSGE